MGIQVRPSDSVTVNYLELGMPYVFFRPALTGGGYGAWTALGVVDEFAIAKSLSVAELRSSQSGRSELIRELVQTFDASWEVGILAHTAENLRYLLASTSQTAVSGGALSVSAQEFSLTNDEEDFNYIGHPNVDESTIVPTCAAISEEAVGTGDGVAGAGSGTSLGDFALTWKPKVIADVVSFYEGSTNRTADIVAGAAPGAGEIGLSEGVDADAGKLIWPAGEAPDAGDALVCTYTPSHIFGSTTWVSSPKQGLLRMLNIGTEATDALRAFQPMYAAYDYDEVAHTDLVPMTQGVFEGQAKMQLLTDVGINILWTVPSASIRMSDDALTFSKDEPATQTLIITLLNDGSSTPYGTLSLYDESVY